jgi:hypothetical protein
MMRFEIVGWLSTIILGLYLSIHLGYNCWVQFRNVRTSCRKKYMCCRPIAKSHLVDKEKEAADKKAK